MIRTFVYSVVVLFATTAAAAPLVDQVIAAHGGAAAIRRATSVRQTGTVNATMRNAAGKLTRIFSCPGRLRIEIVYPETTEVRILDGARGSRDGRVVDGPPLVAMVLQAARINLPCLLVARQSSVIEGEAISREGRRYRTLRVPITDAIALDVEIDPDTMRIARSAGRIPGPQPFEFATTYSDYRAHGGVLFAHREQNYSGGRLTGETTLERIDVTPELDPSTFRVHPSEPPPAPHPQPDVRPDPPSSRPKSTSV